MMHEDFIAAVARRLDWPEEKTAAILETIGEVMGAELKMNNPLIIDDFGSLKTNILPEYILVNPDTGERFLMPPVVAVVFEAFFQENGTSASLRADFIPDEALYSDLNSAFSQFESTPLNEGVRFPGIPEIVAEEPESEVKPEPEPTGESAFTGETESIGEPEETEEPGLLGEPEPNGKDSPAGIKESPPRYRSSRRGVRSNRKISSVWIPIAGGIAIVVASLFFFKGERNK